MELLFKDTSFKFEALRAAGFAVDDGADISEVLLTAAAIPEGDEEAWMREWKATADRLHERAKHSFERGDKISAREAFLARIFLLPQRGVLSPQGSSERSARQGAIRPFSRNVRKGRQVASMDRSKRSPSLMGMTSSLAICSRSTNSGKPRPTLIYSNGFDSTTEEGYFVIGAAALRRGFNVILYDGPGAGRMIRERNVPFRPDWEAVLGPVMDYAETRKEIDSSKLVLFGYSMGGYLCARTAASDTSSGGHRAR